MPTSAGSENSDDKTTAIDDFATESTKGILKFLSPSQSEWRELNPMIADDAEDVETKKRQASEAKEALRETLLAALEWARCRVLISTLVEVERPLEN